MTEYYPMAELTNGEKLHTYDSVLSIDRVVHQFNIWQKAYDYQIKKAWAQVYIDGKHFSDIEFEEKWIPQNTIVREE